MYTMTPATICVHQPITIKQSEPLSDCMEHSSWVMQQGRKHTNYLKMYIRSFPNTAMDTEKALLTISREIM